MNEPTQPTQPTLKRPPVTPENMAQRLKKARTTLEAAFKDFHLLLNDKLLDVNKSDAKKTQEKHIVDELVKACVILESANIGEGVMALAVIALREHLKVRDRVNELEYDLEMTKKTLNLLKKDLGK